MNPLLEGYNMLKNYKNLAEASGLVKMNIFYNTNKVTNDWLKFS